MRKTVPMQLPAVKEETMQTTNPWTRWTLSTKRQTKTSKTQPTFTGNLHRGTREEVSFASTCKQSQRNLESSFWPDVTAEHCTWPCINCSLGNVIGPLFSSSMALATEMYMTCEIHTVGRKRMCIGKFCLRWMWMTTKCHMFMWMKDLHRRCKHCYSRGARKEVVEWMLHRV